MGAGTLAAIGAPALAHAQTAVPRTTLNHFQVPAGDKTVHWGYFSKNPAGGQVSGDFVTIETVTQYANDDAERTAGYPGGVDLLLGRQAQGLDRRGAGPMDASLLPRRGRGSGVHL